MFMANSIVLIKKTWNKFLEYLRNISGWFYILVSELYRNSISFVCIGILYFIFWKSPQTIDLLLIFNQVESFINFQIPIYFLVLTLFAFLQWYAPLYEARNKPARILKPVLPESSYTQSVSEIQQNTWYLHKTHIRETLPKLMGAWFLFMTTLAILQAAESVGIENNLSALISSQDLLLFVFLLMLLLLYYPFYTHIKELIIKIPRSNYFIFLLALVLFGFIIFYGTLNTQDRQDVLKLFSAHVALSFLFLILVFSFRFLKSNIIAMIHRITVFLLTGVLALFLLFFLYPSSSKVINPISVVIISFITFFVTFSAIRYIGRRIRVPLLGVTLVLCLVGGAINASRTRFNHYEITYTPATTSTKRIDIETHLRNWVEERKEHILSSEKYPVIFVSSQGGGSKAGLWAFLLHSYLYTKNPYYFSRHLFSLTGSSEGNAGNAMFYAQAYEASRNGQQASLETPRGSLFKYKASELYKQNFLSPSIAALLGRDLFLSVFQFCSCDNRSDLLEKQWENAYHTIFKSNTFAADVLSLYPQQKQTQTPPLLLLNTTHTQSGQYSIISPVTLATHSEFSGFKDFMSQLHAVHPRRSIKLSTAVSLGARFPYLSPVGEVKGVGQFADAGYYDNIGGRVTEHLETVFIDFMRNEYPDLFKKIELINLVIINNDRLPLNTSLTQLQAPLSTLLNVRSGHTREMIYFLSDAWQIQLKRTSVIVNKSYLEGITDSIKKDTITPLLPIGRFLSPVAIQSIENRLTSRAVKEKLDTLLAKMTVYAN